MRSIGQEWTQALADQRPLLDELMKDSALKDSASSCIDVIEGRRSCVPTIALLEINLPIIT